MELGEKLRQARVEAGLSQRQLCAGIITRNMLSQIEHGTARPSMDTLRYLSEKLGKPVSFFLEEDVVVSPNHTLMAQAMSHYEAGSWRKAWLLLQSFRQPDPVMEWQWRHLSCLTALELAQQAMAEGKVLYARQLLEEAGDYPCPELRRQRLLLLGRLPETDLTGLVTQLPSLDEELRLRAKAALEAQQPERAAQLLLAAEDQNHPEWMLLRGKGQLMQGQYAQAAAFLEQAQTVFPAACLPMLETCFRELGDFQKAYEYACRQRS